MYDARAAVLGVALVAVDHFSHPLHFAGEVAVVSPMSDTGLDQLDSPTGPPRAYALFAHCFTCSKDIHAASRISLGLAERGIAVLRFDFTGLGASEGEFANTNFSSNVADLAAAAEFLRRSFEAPQILIGHSLGGAAVLAAAEQVPEARAVCSIGAPAAPETLAARVLAAEHRIYPKAVRLIAEGLTQED